MRTAAIIVAYEFFDIQPEMRLVGRDEIVEVPINLSQNALAVGVRGGVFRTCTPKLRRAVSRRGEKIPSRS
jgi:hypothetical protein